MTPLIPIQEGARLLGISRSKLYALSAASEVPHIRLGSRVLFRPEALEAWVLAQEVPAGAGRAEA
jgi:excisionase family DNA binding protein